MRVDLPGSKVWLSTRLSTKNLRGDLFGGLTAAVVALPLALAFGVASGAGPVAGLYGAICVGFFAALFGGTPAQVSGPTGPMTVVAATVFTQFAGNLSVAFTVVMLAGAFQILFGKLKLGRYINFVPYPVISGFMSGIGFIIIIMQLDPLLGHPAPKDVVNALTVLPSYILHPRPDALIVGLAALAICFLTPARITRVVPSTLIALIAGTVLVALVFQEAPVLGDIPSALPTFHLPAFDFTLLKDIVLPALVLATLGSIDSLLTSLIADNVTRTFHDSDRELVGQGIGNLAAGLIGGIPGAGATIRTLVNIRSGGRTPISGAFHAVVLLAIALGLGPLAALVPHAVLAGILIKVGIDVIDWTYLRRMFRAPKSATICMLVVLFLTVFVDIITAVAVGTVMASLLFVKEMADLQSESIRTIADHESGERILTPSEAELFRRCAGRVLILHLSGPMSFGAANDMTRRMAAAVSYDVLLIDLVDVPRIDASAVMSLETIIRRAQGSNQVVILVGIHKAVAKVMVQLGINELLHDFDHYRTREQALARAAAVVAERSASGAPAPQAVDGRL
ncbi:MAG TPA: SulP family inorganic anion transporter [Steroidobacteraceae bacterium]|nr:SulP family inorganic anion transporter [Steroidobacteraceae bacterium]